MGWNQGWEIAERQIIGLYDLGVLTLPVLDAIMKPFGGTDIDEGGLNNLETEDGKDVFDVIFEVALPNFVSDDDTEWYDRFGDLTKQRWGFD